MRPARSALRPLLLAVACLLGAAGAVQANPPHRWVVPYRAPVYTPGARVGTGVYVFPQISTTPSYYYPMYPSWYGGPIYGGSIYGGSIYSPGSYYYSYSPYWGGSYYYVNPSYRFWYRLR
jgi:hypothetical protein